jgi:hypothetical protein
MFSSVVSSFDVIKKCEIIHHKIYRHTLYRYPGGDDDIGLPHYAQPNQTKSRHILT